MHVNHPQTQLISGPHVSSSLSLYSALVTSSECSEWPGHALFHKKSSVINRIPLNSKLKSWPQKVSVAGDKAFKRGDQVQMKLLQPCALWIPSSLCPCKKIGTHKRHQEWGRGEEGPSEDRWESGHLWGKERGLRRKQICQHLDLELRVFRTVRK